MIDKISKRPLSEVAYNRIKESLLSGEYGEGSLIPSENQLSKSLDVSRVVVREALKRLRAEGIIVTYHGKGSFLANPQNFNNYQLSNLSEMDFDAFIEIMEFRACIERSAIKRAVKVATDSELKKIKNAVEKMRETRDNFDAFNEADYNFHMEILKCSHNRLYLSAIENNKNEIMLCLGAMNAVNDSREWGLKLHANIADALILRDAKTATDLLDNNGEYNMARMSKLFTK